MRFFVKALDSRKTLACRLSRVILIETFADKRRLRNGTFCPISAKASLKCLRRAQILILEIFYIFLRLKFSPSLNSNKNYHFSKVSY